MNKVLCNLICTFIPKKEKRDSFRKKHTKNKNTLNLIMEITNKLEYQNNLINRIYSNQKFLSYRNIEKILSLKDKYKNQKCFIIGNSPSLKRLDLTKLNNSEYKIFTVNKGYKLIENGLSHSNFHCIADNSCYLEIVNEVNDKFFSNLFVFSEIDFLNCDKNVVYFDRIFYGTEVNMKHHYQDNLLLPLFDCATVIGFALQIATYMGFNEIYFIGVDLDFNSNSGHFYKSSRGEKDRENIFSKNNQSLMLNGLEFATKYLKERGVNLYNASPSGILDCMPRVNYDDLF